MANSLLQWTVLLLLFPSCKERVAIPSKEAISAMHLKEGNLITCGPPEKKLGSLFFETSCKEDAKDFNLAMELLHSFEYDEAEKVFAKIIERDPACVMAYWGVAMSNFHPLWAPPTGAELAKGNKALAIARSCPQGTKREKDYVNAISAFYNDWDKADHLTRCVRFEQAMEKLSLDYPADDEAAILYALSLTAAADPTDKSLTKQRKAGAILNKLYLKEPNHPGIVHYIIHTYDYPGLAELALPAARKYASVAPSSAHALHMPSHIFTRLGLWDECIQSNLVSVSSAKCYAGAAGIKGHWDEELHGLDYLVYAYLQKGENARALLEWQYLNSMDSIFPVNFKVAYAFAAIPSRYLLENRKWKDAAALCVGSQPFSWKAFPWQEGILHFARLMGFAHIRQIDSAMSELAILTRLHDTLMTQRDFYKADQVLIQIDAGEAWINLEGGMSADALKKMQLAADLEDKTEKHPVTPCEVLPARELLGDMLMEMNRPVDALVAYEADLYKHPNRFNGLSGAGMAAERSGEKEKAGRYFRQLLSMVDTSNSDRPELAFARKFER